MPKVKTMTAEERGKYNLEQYPNFSKTGSVYGMKKLYYGKDALLVRSGDYIYHVPANVYDAAH